LVSGAAIEPFVSVGACSIGRHLVSACSEHMIGTREGALDVAERSF